MNRRFLRWVLDVAHKTESRTDFALSNWAMRWNGLFCAVVFSLLFWGTLFVDYNVLAKISFGSILIYLWFLCLNAWFFHKMRRKKMFKEAKRRTRWMLNVVPYCFVATVLFFAFFLSVVFRDDALREIKFVSLVLFLLLPYFFTRAWIVVATIPFHQNYGKRT